MENGNFYEYDFLYGMIKDLVENMYERSGNKICLTSGTMEGGVPYPTSVNEHKHFYEEMKKLAPAIREKTAELADVNKQLGVEKNQQDVKAVLGIKEKRALSSMSRVMQECMEKARLECSGFVLEEDDE